LPTAGCCPSWTFVDFFNMNTRQERSSVCLSVYLSLSLSLALQAVGNILKH
jgi:hypothetical protein